MPICRTANENNQVEFISGVEMFELSPLAILVFSIQGIILQTNSNANQLLARGKSLVGKSIDTFFPIRWDIEAVGFIQKISLQESSPLSQPMQLKIEDGEDIQALVTFSVLKSNNSEPLIICHINTSTQFSQVGNESIQKSHLLIEFINSLPDNIYIKNRQSRFLLANQRISEVMGTKHPSELIGKSDYDFYPKKLAAKYAQDEHEIMQSGKAKINLIEQVIDSNGNRRWYSTSKLPFRDNAGNVIGIMGIGRDITDSVKEKKALRKALHDSEKADQLKTAFLANMSHEIRTPLNGILGFSQFLKQASVSEEKKEKYLDIIISNGKHLLGIITDIIDISKIDSGQLLLTKRLFHLNELMLQLKDYVKTIQELLNKKNIEITLELSMPDEDSVIYADDFRIRQILEILLGNAMKFTKEGSVTIGYQISHKWINLYVIDTGIGISSENHQIIFERFRQGDISLTRKYGGNGLGLSIAKELAELMGGRLDLKSELDEGTQFTLTIPYEKKVFTQHSATKEITNSNSNKIGLLTDNESLYELVEVMLLPLEIEVIKIETEVQLTNLIKNKAINPVLLFYHLDTKWLPNNETISQIKQLQKNLPVVIICNSTTNTYKEACLQAGATDYLTEPILQENLMDMVFKYAITTEK